MVSSTGPRAVWTLPVSALSYRTVAIVRPRVSVPAVGHLREDATVVTPDDVLVRAVCVGRPASREPQVLGRFGDRDASGVEASVARSQTLDEIREILDRGEGEVVELPE